MSNPASALKVMSALAVEVAFTRHIVPSFETQSGCPIDLHWAPTSVLMERIAQGERADVIVVIDGALDRLEGEGTIEAASRQPLVRSLLGLAVRSGARHPDISSLEGLKTALTDAKGVAYSLGGASGVYFAKMIEEIGIAEEVRARAVTISAGFTAEKVARGEAEMAIQQISELMSVEGIEIVGPFPPEVQSPIDLSAAIFKGAQNPEGARAFLTALASAAADDAYRAGGLVSRLDRQ